MSWWAIVAIGLATYALRASFVVRADSRMATETARFIRFAPVAVLPAIAASALIHAPTNHDLRVIATVAAAAIAWRTRNIALSMGVGMAALWILQLWSSR